jgi:CDP-4-dehydro-6-deoxyglucose reductase, E3
VRLTYAGTDYLLRPGESVLEGLVRHGVGLPFACRAGACHACLLRAVAGDPGTDGQAGLKPVLAARGYFLACLARPAGDLTVGTAGADAVTPARLTRRRWLSPDVIAVWLTPRRPVSFVAGQHVTLHGPGGVARVYSMANTPGEAAGAGLEFHVRVYPGGTMSGWLARAPAGAAAGIGTPAGDCVCLPADPATPLLLAGTGTGIAPLLSMARDALRRGQRGPVAIIHGAAEPARLYLGDRPPLDGGAREAASVRWLACARSRGEEITAAATAELAALGDLAATRAFLCGGVGSVRALRRALFMAGLSLRQIHADEFVPAR